MNGGTRDWRMMLMMVIFVHKQIHFGSGKWASDVRCWRAHLVEALCQVCGEKSRLAGLIVSWASHTGTRNRT